MRDLSSSVGTEWDDDDESGARGEDAAFCDILQDFVRLSSCDCELASCDSNFSKIVALVNGRIELEVMNLLTS